MHHLLSNSVLHYADTLYYYTFKRENYQHYCVH